MNFNILDGAGNPLATLSEKHRSIGQRFWLARDWILNDQHNTMLAEIAYRPNKRERALVTNERGDPMGRIIAPKARVGGLHCELQDDQGEPLGVSTIPGTIELKNVTFPILDSGGAAVAEVTTGTRGGLKGAVLKNPVMVEVTGEASSAFRLMMLVVATITWTLQ